MSVGQRLVSLLTAKQVPALSQPKRTMLPEKLVPYSRMQCRMATHSLYCMWVVPMELSCHLLQ